MRPARVAATLLVLVAVCTASLEHQIINFDKPVKHLRGRVTDHTGAPIPDVQVEVYDNPQVWDDDGLTLVQKRAKQRKLASATTDERGAFSIRGIDSGRYEVQFTRMGWNILSVLSTLNSRSGADKLCVQLQISGGIGKPDVNSCR
jgi:protocatechuate 3,4-dioxygenase beta subunit